MSAPHSMLDVAHPLHQLASDFLSTHKLITINALRLYMERLRTSGCGAETESATQPAVLAFCG